jgi:hypothetical protein
MKFGRKVKLGFGNSCGKGKKLILKCKARGELLSGDFNAWWWQN